MGISKELKEKSISLNRSCFIISLIMNFFVCICMWGLFKALIHDGFDTFNSTARGWATIMVIVSIIVNSLFLKLAYNLINIFISSKDVLKENEAEA